MSKDTVPEATGFQFTRRGFLKTSLQAGVAVLGAGALGGVLTGCGTSPAGGADKLRTINFQLSWIKDAESAGLWAAMDQGFMQKQGLALTVNAGGPQIDPRAIVASGSAPLGVSAAATPFLQAVEKGAPLRVIAVPLQQAPSGLISLAKKPIKSVQDVIGKRIGLQTGARPVWDLIAAAAGIDPSKVTVVNVGVDPTPLVSGQVDAYWGYATNQFIALKDKGLDPVIITANDMGVPLYGDIIITTDKVLQSDKELAVKFLYALIQGWEYDEKHPDEVTDAMLKKYASDLDADLQRKVNRATLPYLHSPLTDRKGICWQDGADWEKLVKVMYDTKQLPRILKVEELMDNSVLEAAYKGKNTIALP